MTKKKLIYVHGGETFDQFLPGLKSHFIKNIKRALTAKSGRWPDTLNQSLPEFEIVKLKMPAKYNAKYAAWEKHFESQISNFEDEVVLVGWSLGANFLAKYLSENEVKFKVSSLYLVAGCYGCSGGFGFHKKLDLVQSQCKSIYLYHSKDDFVVNFSDLAKYQKSLPQAISVVFEDRNHFLQPTFPELMQHLRTQIA